MFTRLRNAALRTYIKLPEHPARYRIVQFLGRHFFPQQGIPARTRTGLQLYLHPRDWIEYLLLRGDAYEGLTLDLITSTLHPGDVAVFAGVNFGQQVAVAARAVGPNGLIIGIEPQPAALLRTLENLRLNGLENNVRLVSAGLGSAEDLVSMPWSTPENAGAASYMDGGSGFISVILPLSQIVSRLCPTRPRLLLLQVQGYELNVLRGLTTESLPEILIIAFDPTFMKLAGVSARDMLGLLSNFGYQMTTLLGEPVDESVGIVPEYYVICRRVGARAAAN